MRSNNSKKEETNKLVETLKYLHKRYCKSNILLYGDLYI
jgi:hypothetical protein